MSSLALRVLRRSIGEEESPFLFEFKITIGWSCESKGGFHMHASFSEFVISISGSREPFLQPSLSSAGLASDEVMLISFGVVGGFEGEVGENDVSAWAVRSDAQGFIKMMIHRGLVSGFAGDLREFDMGGQILRVVAKNVREEGVLIFPMRDLLVGGEEKAAGKGEKKEQGRPRSELEKKGA